jgi:hypothetical protein
MVPWLLQWGVTRRPLITAIGLGSVKHEQTLIMLNEANPAAYKVSI